MYKGRLVIADFGVNSSKLKSSTPREKLLKEWLEKFETNPAYKLIIYGFTDCVQNGNEPLRRARAAEVFKLLGPGAQSRVDFVGSARMDRYVVSDNRTPEGRAKNRSVVIEFKREFEYEPDILTVKPPSLKEIVDNGLRILYKQKELGFNLSHEQIKRIKCVLKLILDAGIDDRYIPISKWNSGEVYLWKKVDPKFLEQQFISHLRADVRTLHPSRNERYILRLLEGLDEQIFQGIGQAQKFEFPSGGGGSVAPGNVQVHDWIAQRQREKTSIYRCFT